jgi:hypothetical protein
MAAMAEAPNRLGWPALLHGPVVRCSGWDEPIQPRTQLSASLASQSFKSLELGKEGESRTGHCSEAWRWRTKEHRGSDPE